MQTDSMSLPCNKMLLNFKSLLTDHYNGYRVFPGGKAAGAWLVLTAHLHLSGEVMKG